MFLKYLILIAVVSTIAVSLSLRPYDILEKTKFNNHYKSYKKVKSVRDCWNYCEEDRNKCAGVTWLSETGTCRLFTKENTLKPIGNRENYQSLLRLSNETKSEILRDWERWQNDDFRSRNETGDLKNVNYEVLADTEFNYHYKWF